MKGEDPSANSEATPLDPEPLQKLRSLQRPNRPNILMRVVRSYLDDSVSVIDQLRDAVMSGDLETVYRLAHTWKSSSASVGAMTLSDLCKELEQRASKGGDESVLDLVTRVESETRRAGVALEAELRKEAELTDAPG